VLMRIHVYKGIVFVELENSRTGINKYQIRKQMYTKHSSNLKRSSYGKKKSTDNY
jgi:hypothetical protein